MDGSIALRASVRKTLLQCVRQGTNPEHRLRAHVLLLLADGHTWSVITAVLFTSPSTINRWRQRYRQRGVAGVLERPRCRWETFGIALVIRWVTQCVPTDFGLVRSRWTCATLALQLRDSWQVTVSRETIRRWLHHEELV